MPELAPDFAAAFARPERSLLRRRLAAVEPILRLEIGALSAILAAFLFWQTRMRLGSTAFARGPGAAAAESALALLGLALLGGVLAGGRHIVRLAGAAGPP